MAGLSDFISGVGPSGFNARSVRNVAVVFYKTVRKLCRGDEFCYFSNVFYVYGALSVMEN